MSWYSEQVLASRGREYQQNQREFVFVFVFKVFIRNCRMVEPRSLCCPKSKGKMKKEWRGYTIVLEVCISHVIGKLLSSDFFPTVGYI